MERRSSGQETGQANSTEQSLSSEGNSAQAIQ
jgi:hypothetical protein